MSETGPEYEVFALRYATQANRKRGDNFIMADAHDLPMPIDYFIWAIRSAERTIVVDTGFDPEEAQRRDREILRRPAEALALVGIDATEVTDVIVTHLHYDHAGTIDDFPKASFHLQDLEMTFATGRHMTQAPIRHPFSVEHVTAMVEHVYGGRVVFHDGDEEVWPGIGLHLIGGHSMGLQCVSVNTARGRVVLASDASHFYENMERKLPFPIVFDMGRMVAGWDRLRMLADSPEHIVPGHDPLVMKRYPAPDPSCEGVVVRLDVMPGA